MPPTHKSLPDSLPADAEQRRVIVTYEVTDDVLTLAVVPRALLFAAPPDAPEGTCAEWLLWVWDESTKTDRALLHRKIKAWRPAGDHHPR